MIFIWKALVSYSVSYPVSSHSKPSLYAHDAYHTENSKQVNPESFRFIPQHPWPLMEKIEDFNNELQVLVDAVPQPDTLVIMANLNCQSGVLIIPMGRNTWTHMALESKIH